MKKSLIFISLLLFLAGCDLFIIPEEPKIDDLSVFSCSLDDNFTTNGTISVVLLPFDQDGNTLR
ncbi:MAG: lipoprotein [Spirochaetales bacterium]|nr:lipoprotein [Spirochaetales bacterium]